LTSTNIILPLDMQSLKLKQKVHYIPFKGCSPSEYENGVIKSIQDDNHVFVVYHCNGEWENIENYTAARTEISQLRVGWYPAETLKQPI